MKSVELGNFVFTFQSNKLFRNGRNMSPLLKKEVKVFELPIVDILMENKTVLVVLEDQTIYYSDVNGDIKLKQ